MVKRILLSNEFGNNIFTRNTISSFFERINTLKEKKIALDFSSIDFISRSCADEYIKKKEDSDKNIIEANMSKEVCSMFNAVKIQYTKAGFSVGINVCPSGNRLVVA